MDYKPKKTDCCNVIDGQLCTRERRLGQRTCKECHALQERQRRLKAKQERERRLQELRTVRSMVFGAQEVGCTTE